MTAALAVIGALTGIAALTTQVWDLLISGPRVRVSGAQTLRTTDLIWMLSLDVVNVGRMPITIVDVGVVLERAGAKPGTIPLAGMRSGLWQGPALPYRLNDSESSAWLIDAYALAQALIEHGARRDAKVYVRLATTKRYTSKVRIDIVDLATFNSS